MKSVAQQEERGDPASSECLSGARPSDGNHKGIHSETVGETLSMTRFHVLTVPIP